MKACFITAFPVCTLLIPADVFSQNVSINTTGNAADTSAILDISSVSKELPVPRMTQAQRAAIFTPADGLLVYQNDGTTGNNSLPVPTNAVQHMIFDSLGSVAVGSAPLFSTGSARARFLVDAGSTVSNPAAAGAFNVVSGKGYLDNCLQLNSQNYSPTASASADIVASNDAATESTNTVNLTVTGASDGDRVALGVPDANATGLSTAFYTAYVSASNTVTIKSVNGTGTASDPPSGTFRVSVLKY